MAKFFFNITHGFQARMLLRSDIAETMLAAGHELTICSPNANEGYFQNEFNHERISLVAMPKRMGRYETQLMALRQYFLMNPALGRTLNYKYETLKKQNPKRFAICRAANSVLGRIESLRRFYMLLEEKFYPGEEFDDILSTSNPDLVIVGTPGFNPYDVHVLRAAKRLDIATSAVMLSWDNLTSKGYMNGVPDHLLVWSDLMADEAVEYHNYARDQIEWAGAAQFDIYHGFRNSFNEDAWRSNHEVPSDAALLVYGTINPAICPHEVSILKRIIDTMESGSLIKPTHLWIRLHPQMVRGSYKQALQPFLELRSDRVTVEVPEVLSDTLAWDLPKKDATHLASLMTAADIVITTSSTLSIDAACAGTPVINVFFDGESVDPALSVARFQYYTHYAKILATGGIKSVLREEDFAVAVNRYLGDSSADEQQRQSIIQQQLHRLDGDAGIRTAEILMRLSQTGQNHIDADIVASC